MDSLVCLPVILIRIILIRKSSAKQLQRRELTGNAEVAETVTCVGVIYSDFTQHTKYSVLLHDRHNFLFFIVEKVIMATFW